MRKTETLVRLTKEVKEFWVKQAKKEGLSQSQYIERLLQTEKNLQNSLGE